LANLVRTPIHWAVNKLKNAWHGKSLPENVINSMALLLEAAADEQALAIDKLIDDMSAKLLTYINQNIDSYAAALKKMPTPAPKATPDVVPTDPTGKPLGKPEAGPGAVAPGGPALNVDKGDAAKALPPEKVAAATGVDPKTADAAAASGVDPLAKRVEFLKAVAGGQKLNTAFLKALQGALTNVDAGEAIRKRPLIKKLIAGITSDDPHGEWTKIGGLPKIHRSRAIPALDILKQAVVNAITKKDAGQPADLADEIIDLMRHEDKRKPVGPEGMAAIFDRIKKKGKAVGDAGVAPGKPPVAPTPGTTGKPTNPAVTGMDMDPRNPGEPPAGKTPLAPTPEAPGAGQTYKIMGKDMDEGTAIRTVLDMISNAKATSPLSVLAKTGMEFDKDPFFTKYLPDLIKENWLGVSHMPGAENGLDENILTTLLKRAVKKYPNKESLNPEVLKWAGVPVMDTAATPPKSDVAPEVKTGDAPQGDVAASKGDVAPEVKAGEPKPDAVTPPEVKGEEPNPEDEKAEQHAQSIIDSYLAANKKKYHVSPGAMPIVKRRAAVALLIQDGVDIEPDAYKTMSNRKIAELIATKFKPEGEKPAEKPPEKPAEKPAEEAPKDDDQKKKE
jgi:hypothetical protein